MAHKRELNEKAAFKQVKFVYDMPNAESASVTGDFCEWQTDRYPLRKDKDGLWTTTITLAPGRYEYRFLIDGEWVNDPKCTERTANEFGGENCVLQV
jgi:1,4-alpha-glucan branching enzyme